MKSTILVGRGKEISEIPRSRWEGWLAAVPERSGTRLEFMSRDHHRVRNLVVRELPSAGGPIPAEFISRKLRLPIARTNEILDHLERHLFFIVRDSSGAVSWAFPVTVEDTGHHLIFSTGERLDAA